jgi:opacity protein-like surface antigen
MSAKKHGSGRIYLVLIASCLLLVSISHADTEYDLDGKRAFQFGIQDNFNLQAFQGGTISYKKHFSNSKAYRLGLDLVFDFDSDENAIVIDDILTSMGESDRNTQRINLRVQRLFYRNQTSRVKPFLGIGPVFGFGHSKIKTISENPRIGMIRENTSTSYSWSFGITGIAGIEWFASSNISLLAEYSSEVLYKYSNTKSERYDSFVDDGTTRISDGTYKNLEFQPSHVRFGLSVYF